MKRIIEIAIVLGLVGLMPVMIGCSEGKEPQAKKEPAVEKVASIAKKKDIAKEPTKKESSGKEEVIDLGKGVKLEMVLIPAGKFMMGSPASEKGRQKDEKQREVTLTKAYYMGKYEVTQEQWEAVMGNNPSKNTKGAKLPVSHVAWEDCRGFIKKLNAKTDGSYRLPTEAEWEYSCRAGTTTAYSFGDSITKSDANINGSSAMVVGSYKPNAFGLFDLHGNVWEWCEDWEAKYPAEDSTDPKGPARGDRRVVRGGAFIANLAALRSSFRGDNEPDSQYSSLGFRLARTK